MFKRIKNWLFPPPMKYLKDVCSITIYTSNGVPMQNINLRHEGTRVSWQSPNKLVVVLLNCSQQDVDYHM